MSDNKPAATPPEYLAGLRQGRADCDGALSLFNAANVELSNLLSEALDLCVRARKLDDALPRPGDDPLMPRSGTPAIWVQEQYDNDLAAWESRARLALGCPR